MDDDALLTIAGDWSYWDQTVRKSTPRSLDLPEALTDSRCLVVQGVRRSGKSTLLTQLIGHYGLDGMRCAFVNFEDPRLTRQLDAARFRRFAPGIRRVS